MPLLEAATGGALLEILFLRISQYLQQNTCVGFCCEYCEIFEEHIIISVLVIIIILNTSFIVESKFSIKSNKQQLTKKN